MSAPLKHYQQALLDAFGAYLDRARELNDPAAAFVESTRQHLGYALAYHPLGGAPHVPYVCLRVPTGGGKTRIAGQAIERARRHGVDVSCPLVLWLVPSDPIREQTLHGLRTPGELLHEDLRGLLGPFHVLDVQEALAVQPATLDTGVTIVVATMQSFKRETPDGLRVYRQNGALMPHFAGQPASVRGEHSLMDVIRLCRPFVIVDEAHNQGTPLAVDTVARFAPACVLELTATPDRSAHPSNVLRSVSAATLQAEDMLKLPLELAVHPEWRVAMAEALARVRTLEQEAAHERALTGEVIAPVVMLIQAERRAPGHETFTAERVRRHLMEDFQVPAQQIAIATGERDELTGKRPGDAGFPQFVITVDKLREGWDCPTAYVLFSFRATTSATAVEQVLGRVLRMPHVTRKRREALNRSYAYVVSSELAATAQGLRDGLVQNGFERLAASELVEAPRGDLFAAQGEVMVPLPTVAGVVAVPDADALAALPAALRARIEVSPENGTLTLKGAVTAQQVRQVAQTFADAQAAQAVREHLDQASDAQRRSAPPASTPAQRGEVARVPLLGLVQHGLSDLFDESALLDGEWEVTDFDAHLTEADFGRDIEAMRRTSLTVSQLEQITVEGFDRLDAQLALLDREQGWTQTDLVHWLDRNLDFPYSERARKVAWINAAVTRLCEQRGFTVDELAYRKHRLRAALERKLKAGLVKVKQGTFERLLDDESRFSVRDEHAVEFRQGRYAYDTPYVGLIPLRRHFFPVIGNLHDRGEEFECAEFIANRLEGVDWWVRNVDRKPTSFWLQTASDRFYPDFVIRATTGVTVVVEYKGAHLADSRDSREKRQIGELWARRSEGRCRFVMVEGRSWDQIEPLLRPAGTGE